MRSNEYGDNSIKALKGADRVRLRPGVMFGSNDKKGAFHTLKEIVGNATDEARAIRSLEEKGEIKDGVLKVEVDFLKDKGFSVRDYGRGVPMGWNEAENRYNWDLVFNELYAGGKYDGKDESYKYTVGLNGLGAAAVQYVSSYFRVESRKDGKVYAKSFEKGKPLDDKLEEYENEDGTTGTLIKWKVDNDVFPDTSFKFEEVESYCEGQAYVNKLNFIVRDEKTDTVVNIDGSEGIEGYIKKLVGENEISTVYREEEKEGVEILQIDEQQKEIKTPYSAKCEIALSFTNDNTHTGLYFHNTADIVGGMHLQAVQDALALFFRELGKKNKVTIMPYDYKDYMSIIVSTYSNVTSFANQTKDGVSNKFIYDIIFTTLKDILDEEVAKKNPAIKFIMDKVLAVALARKKAKELEAIAKGVKKAGNKKVKAEKFVDCASKDPKEKEVYILEGDSALNSCKSARCSKFQALLPVRGKTLNCLKASLEDIIKNQIVQDIITTLGCGVELGKSNDMFDISKLQFDKIIIGTDADTDGYQIRVLLYTIFYRLMPELLKQGKVYIVETPLFELVIDSKTSEFCYTVAEKEEKMKELATKGIKVKKVNRSKGLGENDPDMMWLTTMNPETRHLVQLKMDTDNHDVRNLTQMLFGEDVNNERSEYVFEMFKEGLVTDEIE